MHKVMLSVLAASLLLGTPALAADAATPPPARIGVVDMQTVVTESEPAKAAKAQLEAKYGKERENLEKQGNALKKKAEDLKNPKVSEEKKLAFIRSKQELDQKTRNFLRKVEQDEVKLRQDMVTLVFSATYEVAKARDFNFVVDVTAGGVLYADQSMDLTQDVLAEVNKIYAQNKDKPKDAPKGKPAAKSPAAKKDK